MKPPFRADHVGSLLRPQALHAARARHKKGEIDRAALRAVEDKCIKEAVKLQEDVGLQAVTDGEFRRDWWHIDFIHGFDGIDLTVNKYAKFQASDEQPPFFKVTGKIRRSKPSMLDHFKFLKSVTKRMPKFTMPSPAMLHARSDREALKEVYPDLDEFWADITRAYREEIRDLYQAGCRYLQIDDTTIAMMGDPKVQEQFRQLGDEPKKDTAMYADAVNAAIRDVPDDMTVAIHTCRGNFKSTWLASGSYDFVAETAFSRLDVDGFFLEYDTERAATSPTNCRPPPPPAAETSRAPGWRAEATFSWRSPRSPASTWTASFSSTTPSAPAASSRCAMCRKARRWCSGW